VRSVLASKTTEEAAKRDGTRRSERRVMCNNPEPAARISLEGARLMDFAVSVPQEAGR